MKPTIDEYLNFINSQTLEYLYKYSDNDYEFEINDGKITAYWQN